MDPAQPATEPPEREAIQSLWVGPRLSAMERLCISSFLRHGHPFHLYVYDAPEGAPPGTTLLDASAILPRSRIFMYREVPSYAGFANFFRYKLLLEKGGWFVDADTICLKPFEFDGQYVFSSQGAGDERLVNLAAMKAPAGSEALRLAWDACRNSDVGTLRWGQTGPTLVTRLVDECGLGRFVQPAEVFCPVRYPDWERVLDPAGVNLDDPLTHAIHLWNEMWRRAGRDKNRRYHRGCLYEQLRSRYLEERERDGFVRRTWVSLFSGKVAAGGGAESGPAQIGGRAQPLRGLRIAATVPPAKWFGGVDYEFGEDMRREMEDLGATFFPVPVDPFVREDARMIAARVDSLKRFRPDVAFSLCNANYPLLCTVPDGGNVFRDVLEIPTIMLWDHGLLQFPRLVMGEHPAEPGRAAGGCIARLRAALNHPLWVHYSPDRGQTAVLGELGILDAAKVGSFLQPAFPCYVRYGLRSPVAAAVRPEAAFFGNVYLEASRNLAIDRLAKLAGIRDAVVAAKRERLTECLWDLAMAEIGRLPSEDREELRLDPDISFFWGFVQNLIEVAGNTETRLSILTSLRRPLHYFGNFCEPAARSILRDRYGMRCHGSVNCVRKLPRLFAEYAIMLDVINLGYNSGSSPKITSCLAAGGLPLFDYKADFHASMGDAGLAVMYRSTDELNAMADRYLTNPGSRREVIRELQEQVRCRFTFGALARRVLVEEPLWRMALK